jgi:hypothetical protein
MDSGGDISGAAPPLSVLLVSLLVRWADKLTVLVVWAYLIIHRQSIKTR